jgi:hypothetical protein
MKKPLYAALILLSLAGCGNKKTEQAHQAHVDTIKLDSLGNCDIGKANLK